VGDGSRYRDDAEGLLALGVLVQFWEPRRFVELRAKRRVDLTITVTGATRPNWRCLRPRTPATPAWYLRFVVERNGVPVAGLSGVK